MISFGLLSTDYWIDDILLIVFTNTSFIHIYFFIHLILFMFFFFFNGYR